MFSAIRSVASTEWKRFMRYTWVGIALGGFSGGIGGYFIMEGLMKDLEKDIQAKINNDTSMMMFPKPIARFIWDRIIAKVKTEGIEYVAVQGALFGLTTGMTVSVATSFIRILWKVVKRK